VSKPIRLEDEARAELSDAVQWYEARQTGLGERYLQAVDSTFGQLVRYPQAGVRVPLVPLDLAVRRVPVLHFPYAIVYIETTDAIRVLAIVHDRRRPGYWLHRV
jgi:plasmid stabilization system protein ParE